MAEHSNARPGNVSRLTHGANSPRQISARARNVKRRFLRKAGLKAADLDAIAMEYLNHFARGSACLDLREAAEADASKDYWTAFNSTTRALDRLDARLRRLGLDRTDPDPFERLAAHLEAKRNGGDS